MMGSQGHHSYATQVGAGATHVRWPQHTILCHPVPCLTWWAPEFHTLNTHPTVSDIISECLKHQVAVLKSLQVPWQSPVSEALCKEEAPAPTRASRLPAGRPRLLRVHLSRWSQQNVQRLVDSSALGLKEAQNLHS